MIALGLWLHFTHTGPQTRLPFWALLVGIGAVLAGGGLALTLIEEVPEEEPDDRFVRVDRDVWAKTQEQAALHAPWDESLPSPPPPPRRITPMRPNLAPVTDAEAPVEPMIAAPSSAIVRELSDLLVGTPPPRKPSPPAAPAAPPAAAAPPPAARPQPPTTPPELGKERGTTTPQIAVVPAYRSAVRPDPYVAPRPVSPPPPAPRRVLSCVGCQKTVDETSDACVVCDRPMCSACYDLSFAQGRPGLCPECDSLRRGGPTSAV
jgi:hypothetical protein